MPQILSREEGNAKRSTRIASFKRGPGVFVYDGSLFDTEWVPTNLRVGKNVPKFDDKDMPVVDKAGRQVFEKAGSYVRDSKGMPVLGGPPQVKRTKLKVFKVRGVEFPEGEPVAVRDESLALKLRGMDGFEEVDAPEKLTEAEGAPKKKRGKKAADEGAEA